MTKGLEPWKKGEPIDWEKYDYVVVPPDWSEELPLQKMHCFYNTEKKKWMAGNSECAAWRHHPQSRGQTPFLRFIRAFGAQLTDLPNPFSGKGGDGTEGKQLLLLDPGSSVTSDGRRAFCETYLVNDSDWGLKVVMRNFLMRTEKVARIECYDERYVEACKMAMAAVDQSYIDEEENT